MMLNMSPTPPEESSTEPQPLARRQLLVATGIAATLAGAGAAWWNASQAPAPVQGASAPVGKEPVDGFWALQWDAPKGAVVRMADFRGHPVLLNFWATWCPPCVEELPLINAFYDKNKANGWQVLGLAIDKPAAVDAFLQKLPLHFPVALAGLSGAALGRNLGNLTGGLPFSIAVGGDGSVIQRKLGRLSESDLDTWARLK
jgi:thiol-disulfide isomerase/thioredoxin